MASRARDLIDRGMTIWDRIQDLRIMRGLSRYGIAKGGLLAGGIAYSALFSIAAALTIAWSVFMALLGSHDELREQVIQGVNSVLPNLLEDGSGKGLINPNSLVLNSAFTPASVIAAGVLVWTAMSMIEALAGSIRAMFGLTVMKENAVLKYVRSLGGFAVMALGILLSSVFTVAAGTAGEALTHWMNIDGGAVALLVRGATLLASLVIDASIVAFLVRVVAVVRVPGRDMLLGSGIAAVFLMIVRYLGTSAVGSVSNNRLLVSFAALATLLLWLNLSARILLMSCAFMANPPRNQSVGSAEDIHGKETPNYVTQSVSETLKWPRNPVTGSLIPETTELPENTDSSSRVVGAEESVRTESTGENTCPSTPLSPQVEQVPGYGHSLGGPHQNSLRILLVLAAAWCSKRLIDWRRSQKTS